MLMNTKSPPSTEQEEATRRALVLYWDAHPISTDSVPYERGTRESFEAIYSRWREGTNAARLSFLESCRGRKVLEIGCGIGKDARFLTENGIDYVGLDSSRDTVALARKHFAFAGLRQRFVNADAVALPFMDGEFDLVMSIGVLHHVPGIEGACREAVRVLKAGGSLRVMFYARDSYHYLLVDAVVRPLIWLLLRLPVLEPCLRLAPAKVRALHAIAKHDGYSRERILATADTSAPGPGNFIPVSGFFTEAEVRALFPGLEDYRFWRSELRYFPLPFARKLVERWWGFFLTMTATKPRLP